MKGYTPGEIIQVTANIHNQSGKNTGNMAASLMQVRTLYLLNSGYLLVLVFSLLVLCFYIYNPCFKLIFCIF